VTGGSAVSGGPPDYVTIKYNSAGQQQWLADFSGGNNTANFASAIALDSSGNVYVTGMGCGYGNDSDYATVKYNSAGEQQWVARYDGPGHNLDTAMAIAVDPSGNVYVTGRSTGSGTDYDCATVKYSPSGQEAWVPSPAIALTITTFANETTVTNGFVGAAWCEEEQVQSGTSAAYGNG